MATNPMLQAVMLFQHHQTTTPFMPVPSTSPTRAMARTKEEEQTEEEQPADTEEENGEGNGEENGESEETQTGEKNG